MQPGHLCCEDERRLRPTPEPTLYSLILAKDARAASPRPGLPGLRGPERVQERAMTTVEDRKGRRDPLNEDRRAAYCQHLLSSSMMQ